MHKLVMPKFTETMQEGVIVKWHKSQGDNVKEGEHIVDVEGDKVVCEIESPAQGKLLKILWNENSNVTVGEVIAFIGDEASEVPPSEVSSKDRAMESQPLGSRKTVVMRTRAVASPSAKRLARERGIDLTQVPSLTHEARITEADVMRFLESRPTGLAHDRGSITSAPLVGVRKTISERMTVSSGIPRVTLMVEVSARSLQEVQKDRELTGVKLSTTAVIAKAVANALKAHPMINSAFEDGQVRVFERINVGVAVDTDYGLVAPVVKDAEKKSIVELTQEIEKLADKAKKKALAEEDLKGGTFTITNLGMFDVEMFTPLINPPQCAVLGVGRIAERPVVVEGKILPAPIMSLCLSFDHRIVDGAPAAKFLKTVKGLVEDAHSLQ